MISPPDTSFKIDRVRVRLLELPLRTPFRISSGVCETRRSVIVELDCGGVIGRGEAAPFDEPFYSEETISSVLALYRDLYIPRLEGETFDSLESFESKLVCGVRGRPFARAGLETAARDLVCRLRETTLVQLIAATLEVKGVPARLRRPRSRVESGVAIGIPDVEERDRRSVLKEWIQEFLAAGYRRVKLKISPGWEIEACETAREVLEENFPLWTDANAAFDLQKHRGLFRQLDRFGLLFHEQPLHHDDLLDHARLSEDIRTPICLDESLKSVRTARHALRCGASKIWNIKVQRVGGLTEAIRIYALAAREGGVSLWVGTMPESGLGTQASLALAAFPLFGYPTDIEPTERWFDPGLDPVEVAMMRDGTIAVPESIGVEAIIDHDKLRRNSHLMY